MRETGAVFLAFAVVAILAHGWGLSGLDGLPGVAPPWAYRWASIYAAPIAVVLLILGLVLILEGGRRARAPGRDGA